MKKILSGFTLAFACWVGASPAMAGFMGNQIQAGYFWPNLASPASPPPGPSSFVVGDQPVETNIQFTGPNPMGGSLIQFTAGFDDTSITFTLPSRPPIVGSYTFPSATFNGLVFSLLDGDPWEILSVAVTTSAGVSNGGQISNVAFSDDEIRVNFSGLTYGGTGQTIVRLDFTFADPTPIPEPASIALLGLGLLGLAAMRRRTGIEEVDGSARRG